MKKIVSIVLVMVLLASAVPLAIPPAAALYEKKIPFAGEDNELTKDELVGAILPYMLEEGALKLDDVGDAAYVYAYWNGKPKTVVDTEGTEVTIYRPIERIVFDYIRSIDMLRTLKVPMETIVGIHYAYLKPGKVLYQEFSEVGIDPNNVESILNLHPDAVAFSSLYPAAARDAYEAAGVIFLDSGGYNKPGVYIPLTRAFGDIFVKEDEAEEYIEWRESFLNAIKERVEENIPEENRTRVCYGHSHRGIFSVYGGPGSYNHFHIIAAGGENIFSDLTVSTTLDPEELVNRNPEVMIFYGKGSPGGYGKDDIGASGLKEIRDAIMNEPIWKDVPAVQTGRVYTIASCIGCCAGSHRYFIAIPYYAKWFYPELFEDLDPVAFHQEYLTRFQGLDYDLNEHGTFVYHPEEHPDGR